MLTARKTLSVSESRHNRLFLSSPYLYVNKVFICDLLRARFRVSESCGQQVYILRSPYPRRFYIKFGFDWPSSFRKDL